MYSIVETPKILCYFENLLCRHRHTNRMHSIIIKFIFVAFGEHKKVENLIPEGENKLLLNGDIGTKPNLANAKLGLKLGRVISTVSQPITVIVVVFLVRLD